ncbi:hypothetical protein VC178_04210 [Polynucleobacter sp. AP-Sanab-80-C2]|uniref:flagellin N-terminal helical domain-containing protein n=1 Tax=Polynucleobacter sp. AP-Sanab-80-C2 TaxID=3108274 RepID=UPI002B226F0C|nr:hypothetical protein [Polynucleobacter sp. AP-Sanab-80-C2]MEA9599087.1 hypothetical protein [Polynucleobacter sp. AP-Sanab-80-C2]
MPMPLSGLAQTLSNSVASVQNQIVDVQNQLATGTKTLNPGENGVVTRLSAQAASYETTLSNISAAQSVITVGQAALTSITSVLTQMQTLANQASSAGLTTSDRDSLNATFSNLAGQIATLGTSASVNSNNLLSGNSLTVTTGIDGSSSANTTVNGVNIATIASTLSALQINASSSAPSVSTTANVHKKDDITFGGTADTVSAKTYVVGGLTFTTNSNFVDTNQLANAAAQDAALATAFANYITGSSLTSTYGSFSGATQSGMAAVYSAATADSGVLTLTFANAGDQSNTVVSTTGNATPARSLNLGAANQIDKVTFNASLSSGQSVSVGGIIYTATATATVDQQKTDFINFITSGTTTGVAGTFTGTSYTTAHSLYSAASAGTGQMNLSYLTSGVQTAVATNDNGVSNAATAIKSIATQLQTVSTGQSTLAAAATGLKAQSSANTALKTGLTDTVNSIQNIDATAMQAKLQQLNNQQSIDYYLVSQMNTEAAAILSIFR